MPVIMCGVETMCFQNLEPLLKIERRILLKIYGPKKTEDGYSHSCLLYTSSGWQKEGSRISSIHCPIGDMSKAFDKVGCKSLLWKQAHTTHSSVHCTSRVVFNLQRLQYDCCWGLLSCFPTSMHTSRIHPQLCSVSSVQMICQCMLEPHCLLMKWWFTLASCSPSR